MIDNYEEDNSRGINSNDMYGNAGIHMEVQDGNSDVIMVQENNMIQSRSSKNNKYSNEKRNLLVNKVTREGMSIKQAANLLEINYNSAKGIIKVFKDEERIEVKRKGGSKQKLLSEEITNKIEEYIEVNSCITLISIQKKILETFNVTCCIETVRRAIVDMKITRKLCTRTLEKVNNPEILEKRKLYASNFLTNSPENDSKIIFIDESGFNLHLRPSFGRSPIGKRSSVYVPTNRGANVSLLAAMNGTEYVHHKIFTGSVNSERFITFLRELEVILEDRNLLCNSWVIMDNARIHNSNLVKDFYTTSRIHAVFLSPYSYMLNPIEFSFSKIKSIIRNTITTESSGNLTTMINNAINAITSNDVQGWYRHIRRNCALAMTLHEFI